MVATNSNTALRSRAAMNRAGAAGAAHAYNGVLAAAKRGGGPPKGQKPKGDWRRGVLGGLVVVFLALLGMKFSSRSHGYGPSPGEELFHGILVACLGALVGAFFSPRLRQFRKAIVAFLVGLVVVLVMVAPEPVDFPAWFSIGVALGLMLMRLGLDVAVSVRRKQTVHGGSEWATLAHLVEKGMVALDGLDGLLLGYYQHDGELYPLHYPKDRHAMTVAATRGGKGATALVPNLLLTPSSVFCLDVKAENFRTTAKQRRAKGQKVYPLDPFGISGEPAARYNPIDELDRHDPDIADLCYTMADSLVIKKGNGNGAFWEDSSISFLWGVILWVALDLRFKDARHLGTVRDIITLGNKRLFAALTEMYQHPNRIVSSTAEQALAMDEKTRANVLASVQAETVFLSSPRIRWSLSASDFSLKDLKTTPMSVFAILPPNQLKAYSRWTRLLVQQAISLNAETLGVKPVGGRPVLFVLDECAALGKLSKVQEGYGYLAGYGIQLWTIWQDLSQIEDIYGKSWETFVGNCGVIQYFGGMDSKTGKYFSELCGSSTVEKFSLSRSISRTLGISRSTSTSGTGPGSSSTGTSDSTTTGTSESVDVVQRPLAFPEELRRMEEERSLILIERCNPIDGRKIAWFKDAELTSLGVDIHDKPAPEKTPFTYVDEPFVIPGTEQAEEAAAAGQELVMA